MSRRGETRQEFLERHRQLRAERGLPPKVEDEAALEFVAGIWSSVIEAKLARASRPRQGRRRGAPAG